MLGLSFSFKTIFERVNTLLTEAQVNEFDQYGYLKGDVVLSDDEVEKLREELDLVMEGKSTKKPVLNRNLLEGGSEYGGMDMKISEKVVQIVNIWMASEAFLEHAKHQKICEEVAQLCGTNTLRIWHDQIQYKPPITGGPTHWHQDYPAWPVISPPDLISAWVALDDATIENGCMWMVPHSHRWGNHQRFLASDKSFKPYHKDPKRLPDSADLTAVPFEIKKGQVGYHHCMTWHGSPHNTSERKRRAIAVHYMPGHTLYDPIPNRNHPMSTYVEVTPGEILVGEHFPIVYRKPS